MKFLLLLFILGACLSVPTLAGFCCRQLKLERNGKTILHPFCYSCMAPYQNKIFFIKTTCQAWCNMHYRKLN
ncbi:unnamed protein product [Cylicocyclus nassatus]|uniref:Uncharacterized protein n=1 Tax=Cylicocyclus nassatus TaxID=53992 RepID=A0AA36H0X7_CYLNA|nr:unnamed protein product [Cylicocyclus nassatus]